MQACNYQEHPERGVPYFSKTTGMKKQEVILLMIALAIAAVLSYLFYMYGICEAKETVHIINSSA